ncbi:MAG: YdbL family protein [Bdellovibrionota bacterium]|nr:MAG: YdbL family protein [Bdellovibrionota bacterium]
MASLLRSAFILCFALMAIAAPALAWALSLDEAKAQGVVGETPSGYLAVVQGKDSAAAASLVSSINAQRKDRYSQIAKQNGTPLHVVEQLAGKKAIENTKPGQYVQLPNGSWARK